MKNTLHGLLATPVGALLFASVVIAAWAIMTWAARKSYDLLVIVARWGFQGDRE